ncbi:MAG TPA: MFS transporter, partial [Thermoplasmata archaeon]|nr:MFS transporter [Thermoplasmata archaeon]
MPVPSPAERPGRPEVLRAVFGATFLVRFAFGLSLSVFASYLSGSSVGIDPAAVGTVGIVASLAPVGEFSTVLLSGGLSDRVGRYPILVGAIGIAALIMLGISLSRDAVWLGALSFGFGVTSGAILTASLAVVGDEAGALERGYEMGRFDAVNLLGWILGFAVGFGLLGSVANADLGGLFLLAAAVLGGGFVYSNRALRRGTERSAGARGLSALALLRTVFRREILLVTLPWFVIYLLLGTLFVFLGSAATGVGVSAEVLALAIGIGGLLLLLTQPYFGRLSDRYGPMRLMTVGTIGFVGVLTGAALL